MASGWSSESDREAMLRRVAIVLSSLPAPVAARLLGSIGPESKQAIRRTMTTLTDIDPLEQRRALQAFKVSVQQVPTVPTAGTGLDRQRPAGPQTDVSGDQVDDNSGAMTSTVVSASSVASDTRVASGHPSATSPLSFLGEVDDETLIRLLDVEGAQAVAVVLASITPEQAARILPRLNVQVQTDALGRIGRLGEVPEAAAAEVAEHFRARLARQNEQRVNTSGRRALDAILAAMPNHATTQVPVTPSSETPSTQATKTVPTSYADATEPYVQRAQAATAANSFPSSDVPAIDLAHKLRIAQQSLTLDPVATGETESQPQTSNAHSRITQTSAQQTTDAQTTAGTAVGGTHDSVDRVMPGAAQAETNHAELPAAGMGESRPVDKADATSTATPFSETFQFPSTDAIHQHLLQLTAAELCQALGKVDTRVAMLALCGLPNHVAEAALTVLPRAHAKRVREKMHSLGAINLREIDDAKEQVARASLGSGHTDSPRIPVAA